MSWETNGTWNRGFFLDSCLPTLRAPPLSPPLFPQQTTSKGRRYRLCGPCPRLIPEAAWIGNLDLVKLLMTEGRARITERYGGNTAALLWFSAIIGHLHVVKWLLKEGGATSPRRATTSTRRRLLLAASNAHLHVVWLLQEGSARNILHSLGFTALLNADLHGHLHVVKWQLEEGGAGTTERSNLGPRLYCAPDCCSQ